MAKRSAIDIAIAALADAKLLLDTEPRIRGAKGESSSPSNSPSNNSNNNKANRRDDNEFLFNYEAILRMNEDIVNEAQENANNVEYLRKSYKLYSDMRVKAKEIESKIDTLDSIRDIDLHEKYGLRRSNLVYNNLLNRGSPVKNSSTSYGMSSTSNSPLLGSPTSRLASSIGKGTGGTIANGDAAKYVSSATRSSSKNTSNTTSNSNNYAFNDDINDDEDAIDDDKEEKAYGDSRYDQDDNSPKTDFDTSTTYNYETTIDATDTTGYSGLRSLDDEIERAKAMHALRHYLGGFQVHRIRSELEAADLELSGQERSFGDAVSKAIEWFDSSEVQEILATDTVERALPHPDANTEGRNRRKLKGFENGIKKSYAVWKQQARRKLESTRLETAAAFKHVRSRILATETEAALLTTRKTELEQQIIDSTVHDDDIRIEVEEAFLPVHIEIQRKIQDVRDEFIEVDSLRNKYREEITRTNELAELIANSATTMSVLERNRLVEEHLGKSLDEDQILLDQLQAQLEERRTGIAELAAQYAESQAMMEGEESVRRRSTILTANKLRRQEVSATVELASTVRKLQGVKGELDAKLHVLERRADDHLKSLGLRDQSSSSSSSEQQRVDVLVDLQRAAERRNKSPTTSNSTSDSSHTINSTSRSGSPNKDTDVKHHNSNTTSTSTSTATSTIINSTGVPAPPRSPASSKSSKRPRPKQVQWKSDAPSGTSTSTSTSISTCTKGMVQSGASTSTSTSSVNRPVSANDDDIDTEEGDGRTTTTTTTTTTTNMSYHNISIPDEEEVVMGLELFSSSCSSSSSSSSSDDASSEVCGSIRSAVATAAYVYFFSCISGISVDVSRSFDTSVIELPIKQLNDVERLGGVDLSIYPILPSYSIKENISIFAAIVSKLHDVGYIGPRSYNLMAHVLSHPIYSILRNGTIGPLEGPTNTTNSSSNNSGNNGGEYNVNKDRLVRKPFKCALPIASDLRSQIADFYNAPGETSLESELRIDFRRVCINAIQYTYTAFPQVISREMHRKVDPAKIELCIWRRIVELSPELFALYSILVLTAPNRVAAKANTSSTSAGEVEEDNDDNSSSNNKDEELTIAPVKVEDPIPHLKGHIRRYLQHASLHLTTSLWLSYQHNLDSIAEYTSLDDVIAPESPLTYQMSFMHKCGLFINIQRAAAMCSYIDEKTPNPFYTSLVDWITKHFLHDWSTLTAQSRLLDDTCVLRAYLSFFYYTSLCDDLPDVARGIIDFDKELEYLLEVTRVSVLNVDGVLEASGIDDPCTYVGMFSDGIPLTFLLRHVIPEAIPILVVLKLLLLVTSVTCHSIEDNVHSTAIINGIDSPKGSGSSSPSSKAISSSNSPTTRTSSDKKQGGHIVLKVNSSSSSNKRRQAMQVPTKLSEAIEIAKATMAPVEQSVIARNLAHASHLVYVCIDNLLGNMLAPAWDDKDQRSTCLHVLQVPEPLLRILRLYASELWHIGSACSESLIHDFASAGVRVRSIVSGLSTLVPIMETYRSYYDVLVATKAQEVRLINAVTSFRKWTIAVCEALLERCDYNSAMNELRSEFTNLAIASTTIARCIHTLREHTKTLESERFSDRDSQRYAVKEEVVRDDVAKAIKEVSKHMSSLSGYKEGSSMTKALASADCEEVTRAKLGTRGITDDDLHRLRDHLLQQNTTMRLEVLHWSSEWRQLVKEITEATEKVNRK